ncbi:MAG TPA: helix-turn-helix domain-containing protein [Thermoanaerobaculaceae bacterium]|nr:helix-turn-helix domain-containing protein [Thermoanaerobaculaceae bacterium]
MNETNRRTLPSGWLTAAEAAAYLALPSVEALYRRVERGQVPARRWGRQYRFRIKELDALMGASETP